MKISKEIYAKIVRASNLIRKSNAISNEVEKYLISKGVDMERLRNDDKSFVDMMDYGRCVLTKTDLEVQFDAYVGEGEA